MLANTSNQTKARPRPFDSVRKVICGFDKVVLRGPRDLRPEELDALEGYCNERPYTWRSGKKHWCLHMVCPVDVALMTARDLKFDTPYRLEVMANFITKQPYELRDHFRNHLLLKHNRGVHYIVGDVDYFHQRERGKRAPTRILVFYPDRPCKMTGDSCFHVEDRIEGLTNHRNKLGIENVIDMLNFDHEAYWPERLEFAKADLERLGRQSLNRARKEKRKTTRRDAVSKKFDVATGMLIRNQYRSLQHLTQNLGRDCLVKFDIDLEEILVRDLDMEAVLEANGAKMLYFKRG